MAHKYQVGDIVKMENCYGYTDQYVIIQQLHQARTGQYLYNIGLPLKSGKVPKRIYKAGMRETDFEN
jgi:hypothetical protein